MEQYFRISVDDTIYLFQDLASQPEKFPSLFDHWFLCHWQEIHQKYHVKIQLNLYFQISDFNLKQMPDRWREEWKNNANWLRLGFHALQNDPPSPYRNATYNQLAHDFELVTLEILRFAGPECLSKTITIHYCECPKETIKVLTDRQIKVVIGLFQKYDRGSYHLTKEQIDFINEHAIFHDKYTEITFLRCTAVINNLKLFQIPWKLKNRIHTRDTAQYVELLVHEQYYRKELRAFQRDIQKKMSQACRFFAEKKYSSEFWDDLLN